MDQGQDPPAVEGEVDMSQINTVAVCEEGSDAQMEIPSSPRPDKGKRKASDDQEGNGKSRKRGRGEKKPEINFEDFMKNFADLLRHGPEKFVGNEMYAQEDRHEKQLEKELKDATVQLLKARRLVVLSSFVLSQPLREMIESYVYENHHESALHDLPKPGTSIKLEDIIGLVSAEADLIVGKAEVPADNQKEGGSGAVPDGEKVAVLAGSSIDPMVKHVLSEDMKGMKNSEKKLLAEYQQVIQRLHGYHLAFTKFYAADMALLEWAMKDFPGGLDPGCPLLADVGNLGLMVPRHDELEMDRFGFDMIGDEDKALALAKMLSMQEQYSALPPQMQASGSNSAPASTPGASGSGQSDKLMSVQ